MPSNDPTRPTAGPDDPAGSGDAVRRLEERLNRASERAERLIVYFFTSGIVALAVAAVLAYFVGRAAHRPTPSQLAQAPEPSKVERPRPAQRRVRPAPQTPIGRLFAERPAWSGAPADPFEP